jgi:hypothetical protein
MSTLPFPAGTCPHCGAPTKPRAIARHDDFARDGQVRYDIEALSTEASADRAFDETAKVRATQEDIRKLLDKRRKAPK